MGRKISGASMTSTLNVRSFRLVKFQTQITGEAEKILNEYLSFRNETEPHNEVTVEAVIDALITERLANETEFLEWKKSNPKMLIEVKPSLKKKKIDIEEETKNIEA